MNEHKYRLGQVVKWKTKLHTEYTWVVPENKLDSVTLMEM